MTKLELQEKLINDIKAQFKDHVKHAEVDHYGMPVVEIDPEIHVELPAWLKNSEEWQFNHFTDITSVDYLNRREIRFEVVVHLRSHKNNIRIRIKTPVGGENPKLPTLSHTFIGSHWTEREVYDLMGIEFTGHPRMTRLLNPDDFDGHPLRKDFPIKGKFRGSFPKGTVISNKRREPNVAAPTHPKPLDQLMPRTVQEQKREVMKLEYERKLGLVKDEPEQTEAPEETADAKEEGGDAK